MSTEKAVLITEDTIAGFKITDICTNGCDFSGKLTTEEFYF